MGRARAASPRRDPRGEGLGETRRALAAFEGAAPKPPRGIPLALLLPPLRSLAAAAPPALDAGAAGRFAELALTCVHREYPNRVSHVLHGDADARPPRALTPAFYGCDRRAGTSAIPAGVGLDAHVR